ncbi:MAG: farnesyl diphosphate synthase [Robiginitomaculum sp.]
MSDFLSHIKSVAREFETHLDAALPKPQGATARVAEAMRYSALGGGKRLRPFFVVETARLFGHEDEGVWLAASALECVHVYSLIHDDLPCMDDDDMRRGKATVHRAFDEATAVLAGDGLLTLAFELLTREAVHADANVRLNLIAKLAMASGHAGMIGGQMIDLTMGLGGGTREVSEAVITQLQDLKTGALIHYAVMAGAMLGGANAHEKAHLSAYARHIGLIFQITDDLLDVTGSADIMGKAAGKDEQRGKATFVSILGIDGARRKAQTLANEAHGHLDGFGQKADALRSAIDFVLKRDN